jgi:hypothetical protein
MLSTCNNLIFSFSVLPSYPVCASSDFLRQSKTLMCCYWKLYPDWWNASSGRAIIMISCHHEVPAAVNTYHSFLFSSIHSRRTEPWKQKYRRTVVLAETSIAEIAIIKMLDMSWCYFCLDIAIITTSTWASNSTKPIQLLFSFYSSQAESCNFKMSVNIHTRCISEGATLFSEAIPGLDTSCIETAIWPVF